MLGQPNPLSTLKRCAPIDPPHRNHIYQTGAVDYYPNSAGRYIPPTDQCQMKVEYNRDSVGRVVFTGIVKY